jgi:hypothetical protein
VRSHRLTDHSCERRESRAAARRRGSGGVVSSASDDDGGGFRDVRAAVLKRDGGTTLFRSAILDEDGGKPANIAASGASDPICAMREQLLNQLALVSSEPV